MPRSASIPMITNTPAKPRSTPTNLRAVAGSCRVIAPGEQEREDRRKRIQHRGEAGIDGLHRPGDEDPRNHAVEERLHDVGAQRDVRAPERRRLPPEQHEQEEPAEEGAQGPERERRDGLYRDLELRVRRAPEERQQEDQRERAAPQVMSTFTMRVRDPTSAGARDEAGADRLHALDPDVMAAVPGFGMAHLHDPEDERAHEHPEVDSGGRITPRPMATPKAEPALGRDARDLDAIAAIAATGHRDDGARGRPFRPFMMSSATPFHWIAPGMANCSEMMVEGERTPFTSGGKAGRRAEPPPATRQRSDHVPDRLLPGFARACSRA
jgi:hypothetical protein